MTLPPYMDEGLIRKVLVDGEAFDPIPPYAIADPEFERILTDNAEALYPKYLLAQARFTLETAHGVVRPQMAMVHREYLDWWLVLLECGPSPSASTVLQEATKLRSASYDEALVKTLCERNAALDADSLRKLFANETPKLFVLVGRPPVPKVSDSSIRIGILEVFESQNTRKRILRINGEHPTAPSQDLTLCLRDEVHEGLFEVVDPTRMGAWTNDESQIQIGDTITLWNSYADNGKTWITPSGPCPLPPGVRRFRLVRGSFAMLRLIPE